MRTASLGLSCRAIFLTFLLLQLGLIQLAIAGDFTTAASLATARYGHTSTLLTNGKVLVVGGYGSSGNLASAELYDPVNNSWSSAGSMVLPRVEHTATLLTNGKVLVAGGNNSGGNLGFAELYDPATNSWSYGGSMINGRNQHTATLLSNGKVLFTGGGYYSYQNGINYYYTHGFAELYDPASNSWSSAGTMNFVSFAHTATLLSNGKVLIAGGQNRYYYHGSGQYYTQSVNSVQLYDPSANSWFPAGNMANTRAGHTATLLNNGKVMVIGGANWYGVWNNYAYYYMQYGGDQNSCEIYDPVTNGWQTASSMVETRSGHTSTTLHSGKILVSGGVNLASAELYDPESNTWTYPAGNLATARVLHGATLLPGWKVLISGGWNSISGSTTYLASTEIYGAEAETQPPTSTATPPSGIYGATTHVSISCNDNNGTGCYRTYYCYGNGCTPNNVYSGNLAISTSQILRFYSIDFAGNSESIKTEAYSIDNSAPTTTAVPAGGSYRTTQNVNLTCSDAGSGCGTTYYCYGEGCTPTTVYTGAIAVSASQTLRYFSTDLVANAETLKSATYTIDSTPPTTSAIPAGGSYPSGRNVLLACSDGSGAGCGSIYYCLGAGCTPSTAYTGPISITSSQTLRYYSTDAAGNSEAIRSAVYTIDSTPRVWSAAIPATTGAFESIAVSPNYGNDFTVFAARNTDGIFKSTDGGASWITANNGLSTLNVRAVAVSPDFATDRTVFAGTNSATIYKSTDAGTSWSLVNAGSGMGSIEHIAISPNYAVDRTIFVTTNSTGVFRSINAGTSWSSVNAGISGMYVMSVAISPNYATDRTVYVSNNSAGVFNSTDGGTTWTQSSSGMTRLDTRKVVLSPGFSADHTLFSGTYGGAGIFKSIDGGSNWGAANTGLYNTDIHAIAVSPAYGSDSTLYAGTWGSGVFKSSTGANSWNAVLSGLADFNVLSLAVSPNYDSDNTVFVGTNAGAVYRKTGSILSVSRTGSSSGTVTADTGTIAWSGNNGSAVYFRGTSVTLTATANAGSKVSWSSGCDSTGGSETAATCLFSSMALDRNAVAIFSEAVPPVTTATPPGGSFNTPQTVTLSCSDSNGSGCGTTFYCLSIGCAPNVTYGGAIEISTSQTLRFFSIDDAGNIEPVQSADFTIDLSINGVCGSAHTSIFSTAPDLNLCGLDSTTSAVLGDGPWAWSCNGKNGGSAATCIAYKQGVPAIQIPRTGQTKCYDNSGTEITCAGTGQDGNIQAGVTWPEPRFTDNNEGSVTDNLTGMIWSKDANIAGRAMSWQEALDYVKTLNSQNWLGHNDWRLPNINELDSLVNREQANPVAWLISQGFKNIQAYLYWSSSTYVKYPGYALILYMDRSSYASSYGKSNGPCFVWPVRSGQSDSLGNLVIPKTGQSSCWDTDGNIISCSGTGQDGELQTGAIWPTPRYTDNGDSTVIDNLTGLVWSKNGNTPGPQACTPGVNKNWQGSLDFVKCLNQENYLGHNDWRLPNLNELNSLIDHSKSALRRIKWVPSITT